MYEYTQLNNYGNMQVIDEYIGYIQRHSIEPQYKIRQQTLKHFLHLAYGYITHTT